MSDEVDIEGVRYISSKRASQLSGYAQDYIGQLARAGLIEAKRIAGLWYVSPDSLNAYKTKADEYKPEPPRSAQYAFEPETVISFDGKQYISAARAAKTTRYHQDYVGQLARSGKILSRQIGNRWYVEQEALAAHKREKDALLGAVQARSVGFARAQYTSHEEPFFTYTPEANDLMPALGEVDGSDLRISRTSHVAQYDSSANRIPIHILDPGIRMQEKYAQKAARPSRMVPGNTLYFRTILSATLTIVIVLTIGFVSLRSSSLYTFSKPDVGKKISELASAGSVVFVGDFSEWIEKLFAPEIVYTRPK